MLECSLGMLGWSLGLLGLSLDGLGFNLDVLWRNVGMLGPIPSELPPGLRKHAPKLLVRFDVLCLSTLCTAPAVQPDHLCNSMCCALLLESNRSALVIENLGIFAISACGTSVT